MDVALRASTHHHQRRRQGSVGIGMVGVNGGGFVGWLFTVTAVLVMLSSFSLHGAVVVEAKVDGQDDFIFPDPTDYNVTWEEAFNASNTISETSGGWNIWQPQVFVDGSYDNVTGGDDADVKEVTYVLITEGCTSPDGPGHYDPFYQVGVGFSKTCLERNLNCQCRPQYSPKYWNVQLQVPSDYNETATDEELAEYDEEAIIYNMVFQGLPKCSWYIRQALHEHRLGLINLGGITTHCAFGDNLIYDEARQVGVPIVLFTQAPPPDIDINPVPEPDSYVGTNYAELGASVANLLKQLRPDGGQYGIIMQWVRDHMHEIRDGVNARIADSQVGDTTGLWSEIPRYPYEHAYNASIPCPLLDCAFNGLSENTTATAILIFYERPLRQTWYKEWRTNFTQRYPDRNLTIIAVASRKYLEFLDEGFIDGMISVIPFEYGRRSVEVLVDMHTKLQSGELVPPIPIKFYETGLISNNVVPIDIDKLYPPQLQENLLEELKYTGYITLGIVLMTSLLCVSWTLIYRNDIVVKASQPLFLLILVSGIVILSSTIIPLSFDTDDHDSDISEVFAVGVCMGQPWLAFTGFTVIFAALFSKTWRVNKLFNSKKHHQRISVTWKDVIAPFAVMSTCNVIILTCWTIIDPLRYTRLVGDGTDLWNRDIESYGVCRSDNALAFLAPLAAINFAVLVIACWQAFEGRNIQSAFSESKYIGLAVASLFQAFLTGLPILLTVKEEPRSFYLVLTLTIFVLCEGILILIFLPKMKMAYRFSQMTEAEQRQEMSANVRRSASGPRDSRNELQYKKGGNVVNFSENTRSSHSDNTFNTAAVLGPPPNTHTAKRRSILKGAPLPAANNPATPIQPTRSERQAVVEDSKAEEESAELPQQQRSGEADVKATDSKPGGVSSATPPGGKRASCVF